MQRAVKADELDKESCEVCGVEAVDAHHDPASHFSGCVAKLFLHISVIDFGRGSEIGSQRVAGEIEGPFYLDEIPANASRDCRAFYQSRDFLVIQAVRTDKFALTRHAAEEGTDR